MMSVFVVGDLAADQQSVMAVAGVGIERHVANHAHLRHAGLDRAHGAADEVFGIEGFRRRVVAQFRLRVREKRNGRDAKLRRFFRRGYREVDGKPLDAGHGGNGLPRFLAVRDEDRPDQIGGRKRSLGNHRARPRRLPGAPQPGRRITACECLGERGLAHMKRRGFRRYRHSRPPECICLYDGKALDTRPTVDLEQTQNIGVGAAIP
jgi:hypothetical protein